MTKRWAATTPEPVRSRPEGNARRRRTAGIAVAAAATTALAVLADVGPAAAADVPGTATVSAGTFSFATPSSVAFSASLNGTDRTATATQALDILDNTGSAAGWNVTLTTTTFTNGSYTLPNNSVSDTGASGACDAGITCTLANNGVSYPIAIPAGTVAPTAVKILSAAAGTGMSGQTWTHTMSLAVPANTRAGTYTSTWTYSLVTGP